MSHESGPRTVLNWALPGLIAGFVLVYAAMYWVFLRGVLSSTSRSRLR